MNYNLNKIASSKKQNILEIIVIAAVMILLMFILGQHKITDFMIFIIAVLSYNIIYGYMGYLSFGHYLYFGTGVYMSALFMKLVNPNPLLGIIAGIIAGAILAFLIGLLVMRTKGAVFALVNMGFNYVGFFLVAYAFTSITGGDDGMASYAGPIGKIFLYRQPIMFIFTLFSLLLLFYLLRRLTNSSFGIMIQSIKHDEVRVKFFGYNTYYYKIVTFVLASSIAAFAGALTTINYGYIGPDYMDPLRNIYLIFANLIGGAGNLIGSLIGGMIYMLISDFLPSYVSRWELIFGIILVLASFYLRDGIIGYIQRLVNWKRSKTSGLTQSKSRKNIRKEGGDDQ